MLSGGIVLLVGVGLAVWLTPPMTSDTGTRVARIGLVVLLGGLGLRFVWRGGRGLWKDF